MNEKAYLVLEDGTVFEGLSFGARCDSVGELVFTTGTNGYIETLTDESYYGQIVLQTFPMIGNYGIIPEDFEGECAVRGYVVREWCEKPSIRERGVMNAVICGKIPEELSAVRSYAGVGAVAAVTADKPALYPTENEEHRVTLIDYGAKRNIIRELQKRGCSVTVVPADTSAEEILAAEPDGVMLSNGPGDPAENTAQIETLRSLLGKVPMFGICLGHQLLALAAGSATEKLK